MATLPKTYRYLAGLDDGAVDEALAVGTRELDGPYLRFAVEVLLQRAKPEGLPAVVDCYHRLGEDLKARVLEAVGDIAPVLRTSIRSYDLQTRLNSLEIASRIGSEGLAYLFDLGLMDANPKVRELAAAMTRQMAERLLAEHPLLRVEGPASRDEPAPGEADPLVRLAQRRQYLFEALLAGAQRYEVHLRAEVVEACMWFEPYLGPRLWALIEPSRSKLPRLLSDLLISSDQAPAAYFLLQAISVPEMRAYAVRVISERRDPKWFRAILRGVQLWHPWGRVRKSWNHIKDINYLYTQGEAGWKELGKEAASAILIVASNLNVERKAGLLGSLLNHASEGSCRRQILLEACRNKEWGALLLQSILNQSNDPAEVRMAAYGLLESNSETLAGDLAKRLGEGDAAVSGLVGMAADLAFWRLWTSFDAMHEENRVAALAGIRGFADHLKNYLRVNLASTSTSNRVRAARMVGLLGLVDALWKDMWLAARDPSSRVRSAVVRFLGRSSRPELQQHLRLVIEDNDGRVQANAIEAIDEAGWPDRLNLILPKLHSQNNRVRGSAAKVLARAGDVEAKRVLTEMLEDSRAEYRLAAIWAIKQIGGTSWLDRLADLAEHDPSSAVRRLVQAVCRDLQSVQEPSAPSERPAVVEAGAMASGEVSRKESAAPAGILVDAIMQPARSSP